VSKKSFRYTKVGDEKGYILLEIWRWKNGSNMTMTICPLRGSKDCFSLLEGYFDRYEWMNFFLEELNEKERIGIHGCKDKFTGDF
jgi:hypothetical protein